MTEDYGARATDPMRGAGGPGSGLAIAAFVLSLVGLLACGPLGLIGLILGCVALAGATATPPRSGGKGLAIAGIAVGGVATLLMIVTIPLLIGLTLPALAKARHSAERLKASAGLRSIGQALSAYAIDNQNTFPETADGWKQRLIDGGYLPAEWFVSPRSDGIGEDYFYVPGARIDYNALAVLVYEDPALDANGTLACFRDMHVEYLSPTDATRILSGLTLPDGTPWAPHLSPSERPTTPALPGP